MESSLDGVEFSNRPRLWIFWREEEEGLLKPAAVFCGEELEADRLRCCSLGVVLSAIPISTIADCKSSEERQTYLVPRYVNRREKGNPH